MSRLKINSLIVLIAVLFGGGFIVMKIAFQYVDVRTVALLRILVGTIFFLPWAIANWPKEKVPASRIGRLFISSLAGFGLNQLLFVLGLKRTTAAHSAIIVALIPVITLIFAGLAKVESISLKKASGFFLSFMGIAILFKIHEMTWSNQMFVGDMLTLLNGTGYSFYLIFARPLSKEYSAKWIIWCLFAFSLPLTAAVGLSPALHESWSTLPFSAWGCILYILLGQTMIPYGLVQYLLAHTESSRIAQGIYIQPVIAILGGVLLLGEPMSPRILIAAAFVLGGVAVTQLKMISKRA